MARIRKHDSHPDYNDKTAFMAWMRSYKQNPGGRPKIPRTNDFVKTNVEKGIRQLNKWTDNEHIKCISVVLKEQYPNKDKMDVYIVGFLSDSNNFSFEIFRDTPEQYMNVTNHGLYKLNRCINLFKNKNIDENTNIIALIGDNRCEFFSRILTFISYMTGCTLERMTTHMLISVIDNEFNIFNHFESKKRSFKYLKKLDGKNVFKRVNREYEEVAKTGVCPWITEKEILRNSKLAVRARRAIMLSELAMLLAMIHRYNKVVEQSLKK